MSNKGLLAGLLLLPAVGYSDPPINPPVPPQGFSSLQNNIPHGTLTRSIQYPTRSRGNRPVSIYTPPGYSATGGTKYPVLYLLHGIGGNEVAWTGQGTNEGNAQHVMDYLLSKDLAKPMIIVMPYGNITNAGGDGWSIFEDVLLNDLIPYVEENYAASPDSNMRALAGLSWGGGQALNFGFKNYKTFTYIGGFSPAPFMRDPKTIITNPGDVDRVVNFCFVSSGTAEEGDGYGRRASQHHDFWDENNINPHMYTIEQGLGHERNNWNRNLYNFAQKLFTHVPTGVTLSYKSEARRSPAVFVQVLPGNRFQGVIAGWKDKHAFTLDGRSVQVLSTRPPASSAR